MGAEYAAAALRAIAGLLRGTSARWVVGGSTGLALRGARLERSPRDLDLYADEEDAAALHALLAAYAVDEPAFSRTERYRSILSHYEIAGAKVELVGAFRIETAGSLYRTEVRDVLHPLGEDCAAGDVLVRVVPPAHELIFNALRERDDRCALAGELIRQMPGRHLPALRTLLARNMLAADVQRTVLRYAGAAPIDAGSGAEAE